jgi:hypothetical protein
MVSVRSRHLIVVWGDVESEIQGPYASEEARFAAAREIRADSDEDADEDGVHWLDLVELDGVITPHGGVMTPHLQTTRGMKTWAPPRSD